MVSFFTAPFVLVCAVKTVVLTTQTVVLKIHAMENPLLLKMDLRDSPAEKDMALISFYKRPNVQWACPLNCRLEGDVAVGLGVNRFFFYRTGKIEVGFFYKLWKLLCYTTFRRRTWPLGPISLSLSC
ncbi:hypothetical protein GOODEAATRI_033411 [Goodea atripinnis]|uniref:Uncharacterized protein n=1 Tax=Goodea atripinnis TaxID=208336 RepID=A0ABV0PU56_9TELE